MMAKDVWAVPSSTVEAKVRRFGAYTVHMADMIRRLVWFGIVAFAFAFAIFAILGNFAALGAENGGPVPVRDIISPDTHMLSGMILLPLACDELTVQTQQISANVYDLAFTTWEDPSVPCPETPTPRTFQAVTFAPATGVTFTATLDGNAFPILVLPEALASTTSS